MIVPIALFRIKREVKQMNNLEYTVKKVDIEAKLRIPTAKVEKYLWVNDKDIAQITKEVDELSKSLHDLLDKLHIQRATEKVTQQIAIVKKRHKYNPRIQDPQGKIVKFLLEENAWIASSEIKDEIGGGLSTINRALDKLVRNGIIEVDRTHRPTKYHIIVSNKTDKPIEVVPLEPTP